MSPERMSGAGGVFVLASDVAGKGVRAAHSGDVKTGVAACFCHRGLWHLGWGAALVLALCAGQRAQASKLGAEAAASVIGRVCVDQDRDGSCGPADLPLEGLELHDGRGGRVRSDAKGRYRMPLLGARGRAMDQAGVLRPRLTRRYLFLDARPLGLPQAKFGGRFVDLIPGASLREDFAITLPGLAVEPPPPPSGIASGGLPSLAQQGSGLQLRVPVKLAPGHQLYQDGVRLVADDTGLAFAPVRLEGRASDTLLVDKSPEGVVQLLQLRSLRVPWPDGSQTLVNKPLQLLATLRLPATPTAPGRLRVAVKVHGEGRSLRLGGVAPTLGPGGQGVAWVQLKASGLEAALELVPGSPTRVKLPLEILPQARGLFVLGADLRGGVDGAGGAFGEGRLEGWTKLPLLGGQLEANLLLSDARLLPLAKEPGLIRFDTGVPLAYGRLPDPELAGVAFGDQSHFQTSNPAGQSLLLRWQSKQATLQLAPSRVPLDRGEVGRFDRAVIGPALEAKLALGSQTVRLRAAADGWSAPGLMQDPGVLPAHVELEATGGAFYRLPHRDLAPGSERIWIEQLDPGSGLPLSRRLLKAGVDYELDPQSGTLLLSAPLGLQGALQTGVSADPGLAAGARLVLDYQRQVGQGARGYAGGGAVLSLGGRLGEVAFQAAGVNAGRYGLLAARLVFHPAPWFELSASGARSAGDPFLHEDGDLIGDPGGFGGAFALVGTGPLRSFDGGSSFIAPSAVSQDSGRAPRAAALRLRLGRAGPGENAGKGASSLSLWGKLCEAGFADGAQLCARLSRGAGGRVHLRQRWLALDLRAAYQEQELEPSRGLSRTTDLRLRLGGHFGALALGALGIVRALDQPELASGAQAGAAAGVGMDFAYRLSPQLTLLATGLVGVWGQGSGEGARDPGLVLAGAKASLGALGSLKLLGGATLSGRPLLQLGWSQVDSGRQRYAQVATQTDRPFDPAGQGSVVGGREQVDEQISVFAETRGPGSGENADLSELTRATDSSTVVGGRGQLGGFHFLLRYERATRPLDATPRLRDGAHLRLSYARARFLGAIFAESVRAYSSAEATGFVRQWASGASLVGRPSANLEAVAQARVSGASGSGPREAVASLQGLADLVYRPRSGLISIARLHYGLEQDGRPSGSPGSAAGEGGWHRISRLRGGLVLGRRGPRLALAALYLADRLATQRFGSGPTPAPAQADALVATLKGSLPLGKFVPALELGLRRLSGAGPTQFGPSVRLEAVYQLGALQAGFGGALVGFTGEGTETTTGEPAAPRIYLILRAAL